MSALVSVSEVIAEESPSAALCYAMHCVGTAVIAAKATRQQRETYLEPIAAGRHVTTLALSEPGTGSHFYVPQTRLDRDGDEFVIAGTKSFVTNGAHADSYVVSTVGVAEGRSEGTFSCVVVDADRPGMTWLDEWDGMGMRSNSSRTVRLEHVRVPAHNLLGEEGDQLWYVFEVVAPYFLIAMAGTYSGVASSALALAREHLGSRRHSHTGELLGSQPVLAHRLGELWMDVQRTRQLVHGSSARRCRRCGRAAPRLRLQGRRSGHGGYRHQRGDDAVRRHGVPREQQARAAAAGRPCEPRHGTHHRHPEDVARPRAAPPAAGVA
jgi:isovaleryl-CoA dehydrogenase